MNTCRGKIKELSTKPDSARGFQSVLKYGSKQHREEIFGEMRGECLSFSMNRYAHHLVLKMLQYGTTEIKNSIVSELTGHFLKMSLHTIAAEVLDYLFTESDQKRKNAILQEFYGAELNLLRKTSKVKDEDLATILNSSTDKQKEAILNSICSHLEKSLSKEMGMFRYIHSLAWNYLQVAPDAEKEKLLDLISPSPLPFHHSYEGVLVVAQCLRRGPKDRKAILRGLRSAISWLCRHEEGYRLLMLALHITDDTPLLQKVVIDGLLMTKTSGSVLKKNKDENEDENNEEKHEEFDENKKQQNKKKKGKGKNEEENQESSENPEHYDASLARRLKNPLTAKAAKPVNDLSELLKDKNASKIFLNLLSPLNKHYLNDKDFAYLISQSKILKENEDETGKKPFTKKPLALRRAQLLKHLLFPLFNSMNEHMDELLRCPIGSNIVLETLLEASRQLNPITDTPQDQQTKEKTTPEENKTNSKKRKQPGPTTLVTLTPMKIDIKTDELTSLFKKTFKVIKKLISQPLVHTNIANETHKNKKKLKKQKKEKKMKQKNEENKIEKDETIKNKEKDEKSENKNNEGKVEEVKVHILEDLVGHFTLKRLLLQLNPVNANELALLILTTLDKQDSLTNAVKINRAAFVVATSFEVLHKNLSSSKQVNIENNKQVINDSVAKIKAVLNDSSDSSPGSKVLAKVMTTLES